VSFASCKNKKTRLRGVQLVRKARDGFSYELNRVSKEFSHHIKDAFVFNVNMNELHSVARLVATVVEFVGHCAP
jgi:hypothetical protein